MLLTCTVYTSVVNLFCAGGAGLCHSTDLGLFQCCLWQRGFTVGHQSLLQVTDNCLKHKNLNFFYNEHKLKAVPLLLLLWSDMEEKHRWDSQLRWHLPVLLDLWWALQHQVNDHGKFPPPGLGASCLHKITMFVNIEGMMSLSQRDTHPSRTEWQNFQQRVCR